MVYNRIMNQPPQDVPPDLAEIVTIGDELLSGETVDTNSNYLDGVLEQWGYRVARHTTVADEEVAIAAAIGDAAHRVSLVIVSGGLGPTEDDLTMAAFARALGCALRLDTPTLEYIQARFRRFGREMTPNNRRQAMVPEHGEVLKNEAGTAPGFCGHLGSAAVYLLPGVPREVRWLVEHVLAPRLDRGRPTIFRRTLKVAGIGESHLETLVLPVVDSFRDRVLFGYRALAGENHIKLSVRDSAADPHSLLDQAEAAVRGVLADRIYGIDQDELPTVVGRMLHENRWTLAIAESCTGGLIASMLTEIPGASSYFLGGVVTYADDAKMEWLGVDPSLLAAHGAVSELVARAMAEGTRNRLGATWGLSATGIAGPGGGSEEKPVGMVFVGLAGETGVDVMALRLPGDRASIRLATARLSLDLLRRIGSKAAGSR